MLKTEVALFRGLFGKKTGAPPAAKAQPADRLVTASRPWAGEPDEIAVNFAVGDLINNLPLRMTVDGRIHAETMIAAAGAIAGYAAQRALFARAAETGVDLELHIATTARGDQFFFGEPLNQSLLPQSDAEAPEKLWSLAAGGAVAAGLAAEDLPDVGPMFAHVAGAIGGDKEGLSSLEQYQPHLPAKDLLKVVWPLALMCFNGELSGKVIKPTIIVTQRWRPVIAATAVNTFIRQVSSVLPPAAALTVAMEAAIYASKLQPTVIEPA